MAERSVSCLPFEARTESTSWARRYVRDVLRAWRLSDEQIETAELAVSELVANAVRHAAPTATHSEVTLALRRDGIRLVWEGGDRNSGPPVANAETGEEAESG